jgi:hypothetical protein
MLIGLPGKRPTDQPNQPTIKPTIQLDIAQTTIEPANNSNPTNPTAKAHRHTR